MSRITVVNFNKGDDYKDWLAKIKSKIHSAQLKAAVKVNSEMLLFYWEMGADIVAKQAKAKWGEGLIDQLSKDLMSEFPDMKGFSRTNLMYIKKWYLFYRQSDIFVPQPVGQIAKQVVSQMPDDSIGQQPVGQITQITWGHNVALTLPKPQSDLAQQTLKNPYIFDFLTLRKDYNERDLETALISHATRFLLELGAGFSFIGKQVPIFLYQA